MIAYVRDRLTRLGVLSSRPAAFFVVLGYGVLWLFFVRDTFDWHAIATLATWMMTISSSEPSTVTHRRSMRSSIISWNASMLRMARWLGSIKCSPRTSSGSGPLPLLGEVSQAVEGLIQVDSQVSCFSNGEASRSYSKPAL